MNKKTILIIGAIVVLYFVFKKKSTTTKSTKVEGGTMSIDEKELLGNIKNKTKPQAGDSPKIVKIKKFFAEVSQNPPKSEQEFLSRVSKAGLSKDDLQTPEAQKIMNPFETFMDFDNNDDVQGLIM